MNPSQEYINSLPSLSEPSNPYQYMVEVILPQVTDQFLQKSSDYGPDGFRTLGIRGQFSEIWRKVQKLKRVFWDGHELQFETPAEVLADLFGHILIGLYLLEDEQYPRQQVVWDDTGRCMALSPGIPPAVDKRCRLAKHAANVEHIF